MNDKRFRPKTCLLAMVAAIACCYSARLCQAQVSGANITVQLPSFGVAVDADGVVEVKAAADPGGQLRAARLAAAQAVLPQNMWAVSKSRKVSLVRLERALRAAIAAGQGPDDVMQHLAGLERLEAVFCYPDSGDLVIAGPAAGWIDDPSGRAVSVASGRPVLHLADLAVALRAHRPGGAKGLAVGCSIDPPEAGLVRLQEFQRTIPRAVAEDQREAVAVEVAAGIDRSLGLADVRVFGIAPGTHLAAVLVEADYRMKRIGIGLEQPPVAITSFLEALGSSRSANLQRWWFVPRYDSVRITDDGLGAALVGESVELCTEQKVIGPGGKLTGGAPPSKASERFCASFTHKYPELAARSPVFAQLRQAVDLLVAAALIRKQDYYGQLAWDLGALGDEAQLPTETEPVPRKVACVANARWQGGRLQTPAGGGVSIVAEEALAPSRLIKDKGGELDRRRHALEKQLPVDAWWWD